MTKSGLLKLFYLKTDMIVNLALNVFYFNVLEKLEIVISKYHNKNTVREKISTLIFKLSA